MSLNNGQIYQDSGGTYYKLSFDHDVLEVFDIAVMTKSESLPAGLIPARVVQENNKSIICYVVTSLLSYKDFTKRIEISLKEQFKLLHCIFELYERLDDLLLNPSQLHFEKEHVYYDPKRQRFAFLYSPLRDDSCDFNLENSMMAFLKTFCLIDCRVRLKSDESYEIGYELMNCLKGEGCSIEQIKEIVNRGTNEKIAYHEEHIKRVIDENVDEMDYKESPFYIKMKDPCDESIDKIDKIDKNDKVAKVDEENEFFKTFKQSTNIKRIIIFVASCMVGMSLLALLGKIDLINVGIVLIISFMSPYVLLKKVDVMPKCVQVEEQEEVLELDDELAVPTVESKFMLHMNQDAMLEKAKKHAYHVQPSYETQLMPITSLRFQLIPLKNIHPTIMITTKSTLVGRVDSLADYVLNFTTIGRLHAEIIYENGNLSLRDFNTLNGTYVNEKRIEANEIKELFANDTIYFANIGYKIEQI